MPLCRRLFEVALSVWPRVKCGARAPPAVADAPSVTWLGCGACLGCRGEPIQLEPCSLEDLPIIKLKRVFKTSDWLNVHLNGAKTVERVKFVGVTDPNSMKAVSPHNPG